MGIWIMLANLRRREAVWVRMAVGLLVLTCLSNARLLPKLWHDAAEPSIWDVTGREPWHAELRTFLPADAQVGYVATAAETADPPLTPFVDLMLTRYALAPIRVVPGTGAQWVLVHPGGATPAALAEGFERVASSGLSQAGVDLYQRRSE